MSDNTAKAWSWIPSLYFAEGIPYVVAMTIAVIMYKNLGMSNTDIALHTSWLYLPWVIKPFWSPMVDLLRTKRWWVLAMQWLLAVAFAVIALVLRSQDVDLHSGLTFGGRLTLAMLWVVAFASATHDIAADGYYMLALDEHQQSLFVGIRSTFYRIASITGQGLLVMLAGYLETRLGVAKAWGGVFATLAALFTILAFYHMALMPQIEHTVRAYSNDDTSRGGLRQLLADFMHKDNIVVALLFMLLYRLSEALLSKMSAPFMLDSPEAGGLGLTTAQVGMAYGTVGVICLTAGGIIGGLCIARHGLKAWMWPMALAITLPDIVYVILAYMTEPSVTLITTCVAIEQLGYGFGFSAYMMYLIYVARGEHKTSHYAFCTGLMALGMMLPGMAAGWLQTQLGYQHFFILVMICVIPTLALIPLLNIDSDFGKNKGQN